MPTAAPERVFLRLLCTGGIARGIGSAQSAAWLAGMAASAVGGGMVPAIALWVVTECVGLAVVLGLQVWVWTDRASPPRPGVDAALVAGALVGLFGGPVLQAAVSAGQTWVFSTLGTASVGSLSTVWMGLRFVGGLVHVGVTVVLLGLAHTAVRAAERDPG